MKTNSQKRVERLLLLIPFLLAIGVMLPRLSSPQFGLLDDAATLAHAEDIIHGNFNIQNDLQAGRFRPIYWLFPAVTYLFANGNPFWFFTANLIILILLLLVIQSYMKLRQAEFWQVLLASILFVLSIPFIENFYTLSKGEPLQLLLILVPLYLLERHRKSESIQGSLWVDIASFLSILLAMMVKETAIIILPLSMLWLFYVWFINKNKGSQYRTPYLHFAISAGLAVGMIFLFRAIAGTSSIGDGNYASRYQFSLSSILMQSARWITLLAFYFHYFFIFLFATILVFLFGKSSKNLMDANFVFWAIWCLLWLAVLIPWEYAESYYLLPFSIGSAILIGLTTPHLRAHLQQMQKIPRLIIIGSLLVSGLLFGLTLPNYYSHARMQLTFDQMNHEMLVFVAENVPENGRILINIEQKNEYTEMIERFLVEQYGRIDITVDLVDSSMLTDPDKNQGAWLIIPRITNQPRLTMRVGVEERFQSPWNEKTLNSLGERGKPLFSQITTFRLANINLPVLVCPVLGDIGFCEQPDPLFDTRLFSYGWDIYVIDS